MKLIEEESQCQRKCRECFLHTLDDRYGAISEVLGAAEIAVELEQKTAVNL